MKLKLDQTKNFIILPKFSLKGSKKSERWLKSMSKTVRKLENKRNKIAAYLLSQGIQLDDPLNFIEVALKGSLFFGFPRQKNYSTTSSLHGEYSRILIKMPQLVGNLDIDCSLPPTEAHLQSFYRSFSWRTVRYKTLLRHGSRCQCCGRGAQEVTLHVDHKKPLRRYWNLKLDPENLQVLCEECNKGKGSWDETDFTRKSRNRPHLRLVETDAPNDEKT